MYDTSFTGSQIIRLDTVDSTNNYAAKLLKESKVFDGTVIMALEQTQGRGQRGSEWVSKPGKNLTFSLILYPKGLSASSQFIISKIVALALSDLLELYGIPNHIKWPNDIITLKGKIAGVLIENQVHQETIASSIIGVGLNVNQFMQDAPFKATSMIEFLQEEIGLNDVLKVFCKFFDKWYLLLTGNQLSAIDNSYLIRLYNFGKEAQYNYKGESIRATIIDLDPSGKLMLRQDNQKIILADLKEINFLL